jgi:two-component sensor histidine kinase
MTDSTPEPVIWSNPGFAATAGRVELAEALAAFDGLPDGFYAVDRDWRLIALNAFAAQSFRTTRAEALGRTLWTLLPHLVGSEFERRYRIAMAERGSDHFIGPVPGRTGPDVEVRVRPFQDGLGIVFRDVTAQLREDQARRDTDAKVALAAQAGRMAVWEHETATDSLKASPELNALLGFGAGDVLDAAEIRARFFPGDGDAIRRAAMAAMAAGQRHFDCEVRLRGKDDAIRWFWMRAELVMGPGGIPTRTLGVVIDVTDRKRIEEQLAEHQADLDAALKAGRLAFIDFDHSTRLFKPSARLNELYGYEAGHVLTLEDVRARYHPEDAHKIAGWAAQYAADPGLTDWNWTFRLVMPDGAVRWVEGLGAYERAPDGTILRSRGVLQDVTDRERWEEHQRLLINELNHRVKNTLAIVQGLAQQSLRGDASPGAAFSRFEARLTALAAAHSLLTRSNWEDAALDQVARSAVDAATGEVGRRVRIGGPPVRVRPQTAVALSLALHELCTNAVKHGALEGGGAGGVDLTWTLSDASPRVLRLAWREQGGPEVRRPEGKGFGRRLLEQGLARELGGVVTLSFEAAGVSCVIEAPLPEAGGG